MKEPKTDKQLLELIQKSVGWVKRMSKKQYDEMIEAQRQSWAKQDMD